MKPFGKHKMNMPIMNISMVNNKGPVPPLFANAAGQLGVTQGSSQANETGGITNMTKAATMGSQGATHGLGFSIDLTKLKANPDDNDAAGNDY